MKVRKEFMFLNEKWLVAVRRPHKHLTIKKGTSLLKIRRDVTLLRKERFMCILRVRKAVRFLVKNISILSVRKMTRY